MADETCTSSFYGDMMETCYGEGFKDFNFVNSSTLYVTVNFDRAVILQERFGINMFEKT